MAQFYTLEEAARVLGMSPDDLKSKAQQREVRAFLDGGSWRFRVGDVDELARRRGMGSDAELPLSDLDVPTANVELDDLDLSEYNIGSAKADLGPHTMDFSRPEAEGGSDHDLLLDELSLPPGPVSGSSSVIIGMQHGGRMPTDSDVRLVPDHPKGASDSDVKLAAGGTKKLKPSPPGQARKPSDSDVTLVADDTSDYSALAAHGSGDTAVRQSPVPGSSSEVGAIDEGSDFELTPSSVIDALEPDSGSDFELTALDDLSDEFDATPLVGPSDSDVTAADPGFSGVNLAKPSDSGINLMSPNSLNLGASSIELAPLSGDNLKPASPPPPKAKPAAPAKPKPSLAKTPPPSARKGEKDIFDDTDFEVDALPSDIDSDDKTRQIEAASDFDLDESESDTGSEVFAIDEEEDVDQNAATKMGPAKFEADDEEEDDGFEAATSGEMASAWDVESEGGSSSRSASPAAVLAPSGGASAEWGGIWVGLLAVTTVLLMFCAFVSMDLVRNLYEFQHDSPASGIVKSLAGLLG